VVSNAGVNNQGCGPEFQHGHGAMGILFAKTWIVPSLQTTIMTSVLAKNKKTGKNT
jgi:hypothetical protein